MPFWTDAYLGDTTHLTTVEHGAYLLLLIQAWRRPNCDLPDDDQMLARFSGVTGPQWAEMKPIVMGFWTLNKRKKIWVQKRLQKERAKTTEKTAKARDSAASRWKQTKKGDANAMRTQCYPEPEPEPIKPNGFKAPEARKKTGFVKVRTAVDAAQGYIERLEQRHEQAGQNSDGQTLGDDVQLLPSVAGRGR